VEVFLALLVGIAVKRRHLDSSAVEIGQGRAREGKIEEGDSEDERGAGGESEYLEADRCY